MAMTKTLPHAAQPNQYAEFVDLIDSFALTFSGYTPREKLLILRLSESTLVGTVADTEHNAT
jgi:hypothetical protein